MKLKNSYLIIGALFFLLTWLFVGLFRDSEFYEPELFIKNRATFKLNFYSPTGMSDFSINDLSPEKRIEEKAFEDMVEKRNRQLSLLPFILIQLSITSLIFGFYNLKQNIVYKLWQLPAHFILNFIFSSIGLFLILTIDKLYLTIMITSIIIFINYLTMFGLVGSSKKPLE